MVNDTGVWVVIPNWNGAAVLEPCLTSLAAQNAPATVLVVDNGSVDTSIAIVKKFPKVKLLELPDNRGFSGGVNAGIKFAMEHDASHVALLNNDAKADPHWIQHLRSALASKPKSIITSQILLEDDSIDTVGETYSIAGIARPHMRGEPQSSAPIKPFDVFAGSGGATLYPVAILQKIGLFDEAFFAYYEDVDIGYRALQAGYNTVLWPEAIVYHKLSHTTNKLGDFRRYHAIKNIHLLFWKNTPTLLLPFYIPFFTFYSIRLALSSLLRGKPHVWLKALLKVLLLVPYIASQRRQIQKSRTVSVEYIHKRLSKSIL